MFGFVLMIYFPYFSVKSQFALNTHRVSLQTKTHSDGRRGWREVMACVLTE